MQRYPFVDLILRGEGEVSTVLLAEALAGGKPLARVPGLCTRTTGGEPVIQAPAPFIEDIDSLPHPDRSLLDHSSYSLAVELVGRKRSIAFDPYRKDKVTTVVTSRGCPYQCRFCFCGMLNKGTWRARSPMNILDEVESLYKNGYRTILFPDDNFMVDAERVEAICDGLIARFFHLAKQARGGRQRGTFSCPGDI